MQIVNTLKFAIGIALLLIGIGVLLYSRGTRGFNKTRQTGAILLAGGAVLVAAGLGFDIKSLFQ